MKTEFLAYSLLLTSWCYLLLLCLSRQLSHLVCPGIAALEQFRHWPFSFLCCRAFFPCSRAASFRSDRWFLAWSYKRRASRFSSGVLLGFGSFRGFSFLGSGFLTFLAFLGFWLGAGLFSSKRCWKVLSSFRGWGESGGCESGNMEPEVQPRLRGGIELSQEPAPRTPGAAPPARGNLVGSSQAIPQWGCSPACAGESVSVDATR